jgi:hypothetical protein
VRKKLLGSDDGNTAPTITCGLFAASGSRSTSRQVSTRIRQLVGSGFGTTGMLLGMKEPYKKGESESILAPSLAASIARCWSKRRQGYRWAG